MILYNRGKVFRTCQEILNCSWEERKQINIDCDKVYPGIFIANGETIQGKSSSDVTLGIAT